VTVVGLAQFARDVVTDISGRNTHSLVLFARLPLWLLFVVLVLALPALLLARDLGWVLGRRAAALRPAPTASVLPAVPAPPTPSPAPSPAGKVAERPLTKKQAAAALAQVRHRLPVGWAPAANDTDPAQGIKPVSCAKLFAADRATDQARAKSAQVIRTFKLPKQKLPPIGATLVVTLTSYRTPQLAAQAMEDSPQEARRCPRWSIPLTSGGLNVYTWGPNRPLDLPYPNRPQWLESKVAAPAYTFITQNAYGQLAAGRNLASVSVIHTYEGATMPADRVAWMQGLRQKVLTDLVVALG
jgi:hypothetical protein